MRKIVCMLFGVILFVFSHQASAQLFVKGGSYIYNKGAYLYVKGDVELEANSNLYLRQEGQLLQGGTTVNGQNKGTGTLSVFQEGTVNNFAYNYWCSPVGNVSTGSTGNRDFGIGLLNVPTNTPTPTIGFTPATISTTTYNGTCGTGALTIAAYWIFTYHTPSNSYAGWTQSGSATNIPAGRGFSMKGTSGSDPTTVGETVANNPYNASPPVASAQRYDFRGKPNDGEFTISVEGDKFTLTGNPYPSALDLNQFFDANTNLDGKAYYWVQDKTINSHNIQSYSGGYATYNFANADVSAITAGATTSGYIFTDAVFTNYDLGGNPIGVPSPPVPNYVNKGRFAPIGQGFMVRGVTGAPLGTATFKNTYRVFVKEGAANESVFQRNSNASTTTDFGFYGDIPNLAGIDFTQISKAPPPHLKINSTLNGSSVRQLAIGFRPNSLDGVDRSDAKFPDAALLPLDVYMYLGNSEYCQSVTSFDINKRFPIGFRNTGTTTATYRIQLFEFVNFDAADHVYLYDGDTGLYHEITNAYYEVVLAPGTYNNRFEITFLNNTLDVDTNISTDFVIVQNNPNQQLSVANPNLLDVKSVALYDMGGKLIFNKVNLGAEASYQFSTASLSEGVYIVKLHTADDRSMGQKIIVKRKS